MSFTIKDKTLFISHTEHSGLRYQNICEFGIRRIKKVQVVVYSPYVQVMAAAYPQKSNMQQALSINSL